jgi:hypothetical protein
MTGYGPTRTAGDVRYRAALESGLKTPLSCLFSARIIPKANSYADFEFCRS